MKKLLFLLTVCMLGVAYASPPNLKEIKFENINIVNADTTIEKSVIFESVVFNIAVEESHLINCEYSKTYLEKESFNNKNLKTNYLLPEDVGKFLNFYYNYSYILNPNNKTNTILNDRSIAGIGNDVIYFIDPGSNKSESNNL